MDPSVPVVAVHTTAAAALSVTMTAPEAETKTELLLELSLLRVKLQAVGVQFDTKLDGVFAKLNDEIGSLRGTSGLSKEESESLEYHEEAAKSWMKLHIAALVSELAPNNNAYNRLRWAITDARRSPLFASPEDKKFIDKVDVASTAYMTELAEKAASVTAVFAPLEVPRCYFLLHCSLITFEYDSKFTFSRLSCSHIALPSQMPQWVWWVFCVVAMFAWGTQYTFTPRFRQVSPFMIMMAIGAVTFVVGAIGQIIRVSVSSSSWHSDWQTLCITETLVAVLVYACLSVLGNIALLFATAASPDNEGLITSITSLYPLVTMVFLIAFSREDKHLNIRYLIPAMLLAVCALVLFELAKFMFVEPVAPSGDVPLAVVSADT